VDHSGRAPLWQQLAASLRDSISDGEYPVGSRIPSKRTLSQQHEVSVTTVDRAVRELKDEGLIDPEKGKGLYVVAVPGK
jgi:DNA-binding GntR family transcriptional regulator